MRQVERLMIKESNQDGKERDKLYFISQNL